MIRNQSWLAWRLVDVALALMLTGLLTYAAPRGHGLPDQDVAATIGGEVHAGHLLGDAARASPEDQTYVENFTTYTAKSYTDNARWDVFQHRLSLSPFAGGIYAQPATATDSTGGAYVVWQDLRNNQANGDWDIYAQRVDSRGNRLWPADVRINTAPAPGYQAVPAVVVDSQGNAIVIWAESLEVPFAVYAQKLSPAGHKLWPADARVNGAPAYRIDWGPRDSLAAAIDGQDNVIVVWQGSITNDWSDPDVLAQKLGPDGQRRWTNDVKVNSDSGHPQRFMAVDASSSGVSVVAWVDERHGGEDIYAQRLDSQGQRVWPSEVKVSAGAGVRLQGDPNVVLDDQTQAFVVWRQGPSDSLGDGAASTIYAQRLLGQGTLAWTGNVRINRDTSPVFRGRPRAALAPGGDAIVVWEDNREGYPQHDIFSQRLTPAGTLRWTQDEPLSPADWWGQGLPDVSVTGNRAVLVWMRFAGIYVQFLDVTNRAHTLPLPAQVNESDGRAKQWMVDVAPLSTGAVVVTWGDDRHDNGDVYAQAINVNRQFVWPVGLEVNVPDNADDWRPRLAIDRVDRMLVVWNHNDHVGIDGRLLDANGVPVWDGDRAMNADLRQSSYAAVAALPDDSFAVAWVGQRTPESDLWDIYLQRIDQEGNRLWPHDLRINAGNYRIHGDEVDIVHQPMLAVDAQGHLVVAWRGEVNGRTDIYVRRIAPTGVPDWGQDRNLGNHLKQGLTGWDKSCALAATDAITLVWPAEDAGQEGIYAQRLNLSGQTVWGPRWVQHAAAPVKHRNPDLVAVSSSEVVVTWEDEQSGHHLYAQRLSAAGTALWAQPLRIDRSDVWPTFAEVTQASDGSFAVAWFDGRFGNENVFAQRFSGGGSLLWDQDLQLGYRTPVDEYFYDPVGVAESLTVDTTPDPILQVSFTVSQTLNGGHINYALSNDGGQHWETASPGELHSFAQSGSNLRWRATLYPSEHSQETPVVGQLTLRYGSGVGGDAFEPDDTCVQSKPIAIDGTEQAHVFHQPSDIDWVRFDAVAAMTYVVEGQVPSGSQADLVASLYDACAGLPRINQGYAFASGIRLVFRAFNSGPLWLRLVNQNPDSYGPAARYTLSVRELSNEPRPGAVIIVAGRLTLYDPLQANINAVSRRVYEMFMAHGYTDNRILYLATDFSLPGVDGLPTKANLQAALTTWAPSRAGPDRALTLYLVDHGNREVFYLDQPYHEWVTPQQVDTWISYLETLMPQVRVNVIIEACQSGSFIDAPQTLSRSGRVVMTSTSAWANAYASQHGAVFSDHLLTALNQNMNLYAAFQRARDAALSANESQIPWLDDNGDQVANASSDGQEAALRGFADAGSFPDSFAVWPPLISQAGMAGPIVNGQGTLRATVLDDQAVELVWAVIYPPSYQPPPPGSTLVPEVPTAVLIAQGNNQYATVYPGFQEPGAYRIVIYARDNQNLQASPVTFLASPGAKVYLPDVQR